MASKKKTITTKVKKKKWYKIVAPSLFNEKVLGESLLVNADKLKNKFLTANLSKITNSMRDQNINLTFQVDTVKENTGHTKLVKYAMMPSIIKRFVRRDKSKIADSFIARDKNNTPIRLKPLVITFRNATRSQKTAIRLMTRDFIKTYISKITFDNFVKDLLSYTFQKKLKASIKKIMPIRFSDIRIVEYANVKGIVRKKVKVEEEIPEEEVSEEAPTEEVEEKVEKETPVEKETKKSKEEAKESVEEKTEEPEAESKEETSEEKPKKD